MSKKTKRIPSTVNSILSSPVDQFITNQKKTKKKKTSEKFAHTRQMDNDDECDCCNDLVGLCESFCNSIDDITLDAVTAQLIMHMEQMIIKKR